MRIVISTATLSLLLLACGQGGIPPAGDDATTTCATTTTSDTCMVGPAGPTGDTGPAGPVGPQGPAGTNGTNGAPGAVGAVGATGPRGFTGDTGVPGPQGIPGNDGATGAVGPRGLTGPVGPGGVIYDANGNADGTPVTIDLGGDFDSRTMAAILVHRTTNLPVTNPAIFPEGYIVVLAVNSASFFDGDNCTGTLYMDASALSRHYDNVLYRANVYVTGGSGLQLFQPTGTTVSMNHRSTLTNGSCSNVTPFTLNGVRKMTQTPYQFDTSPAGLNSGHMPYPWTVALE
jgi:hypothetical protein